MRKVYFFLIGLVCFLFVLPLMALDTWMSTDIRLDLGDLPGANHSMTPQIACTGSRVYAVWTDSRNGSGDIYFNYSIDWGKTWQSSDIRLDTGDTAGANNSSSPQLVCTGSNVYVVWQDYRNGNLDIYFNYSTKFGTSWQPSDIRLDTGDTAGAHHSQYPQIAYSEDNIYVTWFDLRNGANDIYFNYSHDGGASWQTPDIRIDTGDAAGANASENPQLTCLGLNVYVVWSDKRNGSDDIYLNYSTAYGTSWQSSDIRLDTGDTAGASASSDPQISSSGDNIYVVWQDKRNGYYPDIYFNYSHNGGANWQPSDIRLDTGDGAGFNASLGPQIACSGNNVYVVWTDRRNSYDDLTSDIYFNYSFDGGSTWQPWDLRINKDTPGANSSGSAQIACWGYNVYVIWADKRNSWDNSISDIYFNYSTSGGAGWQWPDIRLDTGSNPGGYNSRSPQIACTDNNIYAVWEDSRNGSEDDIYFNTAIPWVDIKANGSDGPISISQSDLLKIKVSLSTNGLTVDADWWLAYKSPAGWHYFDYSSKTWKSGLNVTLQDHLFDVDNKRVFRSNGLSAGKYLFYFGVDLNMDGNLNMSELYYDEVQVTVTIK